MGDLISRQTAIDGTMEIPDLSVYAYCSFLDMLSNLPSVQERKKGRWEKAYADHEAFGVRPFYRYCSVCNEVTVFAYSYCPHCGASMMEGAEE